MSTADSPSREDLILASDLFDPEVWAWEHGGRDWDDAMREHYDHERDEDHR